MRGRTPVVAAGNLVAAQHSVVFQNRKRVTRTVGLVAIAFTMCWLPTFILSFTRIVSGTERVHRGELLHEVAMFGTFVNEAVNPFIYCAFDRNIKARAELRVICTHSEDGTGLSNSADQTHNIATEFGQNQMSFRNLELTLTTNRPS